MISLDELKELIEIEKRIRPERDNPSHLRYQFYDPTIELELECMSNHGISYANKFFLESYCYTTFSYINQHLRESCGQPINEFVIQYEKALNKILASLDSCDNGIVWRWVNCKEGFDYLRNHVGKRVLIPEFKSTSLRKLPKRTYWKIKTSNKSRGKNIYKYINKAKGHSEQDVLFQSKTTFLITKATKNCIYMQEDPAGQYDFKLCENYWMD